MDDVTLTHRLCALLARLPGWEGPELSKHEGAEVAIFYGAIGASPHRAVGVRVYNQAGGTSDQRNIRRVQLRIRGARNSPADADAIAGIAFAVFDGFTRTAGINSIRRDSFAPLGSDKNGREERADNYIIILDNQEAHTP